MSHIREHIDWHIRKVIWKILSKYGVVFIDRPVIWGDKRRLHLHTTVTGNALFNTRSGEIFVGEKTIFGLNCMILTGRHERSWISGEWIDSVPGMGYDIHIGKRCWICSGAIILGGVTIGDECVIAAGAIVTKDVSPGLTIKGVY